MKSMLHEASSVIKAIQKAWDEAGKPVEFTIKVLEKGEKNFLGFCKMPAVVSIAYEPKRQLDNNRRGPDLRGQQNKKNDNKQVVQGKTQPQQQVPGQPIKFPQARPQVQSQQKPQGIVVRPVLVKQAGIQQQQSLDTLTWAPEWVDDVSVWLNELLDLLGSSIKFETQVTGKQLLILFNDKVLESAADEKMIFISFSYLLMQFLKKKHKKKLSKYQIVLNSKVLSSDDVPNPA